MTAPVETRPVADDELLITRVFDAPAALVFRIWEDRAHAIRWWGPKNFTTPYLEMDFRPGGKWRACIVSPAKKESWMSGVYREIVRDKRIVFTFMWDVYEDHPGHESLITVTFDEQDGRTTQTFHQAPFPTVASRDDHLMGWTEFVDKEGAYAERLALEDAA
jgi:uncharacterized protein YndB with AHSA1/START domain